MFNRAFWPILSDIQLPDRPKDTQRILGRLQDADMLRKDLEPIRTREAMNADGGEKRNQAGRDGGLLSWDDYTGSKVAGRPELDPPHWHPIEQRQQFQP